MPYVLAPVSILRGTFECRIVWLDFSRANFEWCRTNIKQTLVASGDATLGFLPTESLNAFAAKCLGDRCASLLAGAATSLWKVHTSALKQISNLLNGKKLHRGLWWMAKGSP